MKSLEFIDKVCKTIESIIGKKEVKVLSYKSEDFEILINERIILRIYMKLSTTTVKLFERNGEDPIIAFPPDREECLKVIKLQIRYISDHFDDILTTSELMSSYIDKFLNETEKKFLSGRILMPSSTKEGVFTMRIVRYDPINMLFVVPGDSMSAYVDITHDGTNAKDYYVTVHAAWNISIYNRVPNWIDKIRDKFSGVKFEDNYISFSVKSDRILLSEALEYEFDDVFRVSLGWRFIQQALGCNGY